MVTIGVDVASQPYGTAACWIRWRDGRGTVQSVEQSIADDRLRSILLDEPAAKVGVDVPLGWPTAFVQALTAHHAGAHWPPASIRKLVRRVTDWHVHESVGQLPLSVSTDRIAYAALRVAALLPGTIDRRGDQRVVEVYPAAALRRWLLPWQRYKGSGRLVGLEELVKALRDVTKTWLVAGQAEWSRLAGNDDLFDALVASLIARAKVLGLCEPVPPQHNEAARAEGWIALPMTGSLDELPRAR